MGRLKKYLILLIIIVCSVFTFAELPQAPNTVITENPDKEVTTVEAPKNREHAEMNIAVNKLIPKEIDTYKLSDTEFYIKLPSNLKLEEDEVFYLSENIEKIPDISTINGKKFFSNREKFDPLVENMEDFLYVYNNDFILVDRALYGIKGFIVSKLNKKTGKVIEVYKTKKFVERYLERITAIDNDKELRFKLTDEMIKILSNNEYEVLLGRDFREIFEKKDKNIKKINYKIDRDDKVLLIDNERKLDGIKIVITKNKKIEKIYIGNVYKNAEQRHIPFQTAWRSYVNYSKTKIVKMAGGGYLLQFGEFVRGNLVIADDGQSTDDGVKRTNFSIISDYTMNAGDKDKRKLFRTDVDYKFYNSSNSTGKTLGRRHLYRPDTPLFGSSDTSRDLISAPARNKQSMNMIDGTHVSNSHTIDGYVGWTLSWVFQIKISDSEYEDYLINSGFNKITNLSAIDGKIRSLDRNGKNPIDVDIPLIAKNEIDANFESIKYIERQRKIKLEWDKIIEIKNKLEVVDGALLFYFREDGKIGVTSQAKPSYSNAYILKPGNDYTGGGAVFSYKKDMYILNEQELRISGGNIEGSWKPTDTTGGSNIKFDKYASYLGVNKKDFIGLTLANNYKGYKDTDGNNPIFMFQILPSDATYGEYKKLKYSQTITIPMYSLNTKTKFLDKLTIEITPSKKKGYAIIQLKNPLVQSKTSSIYGKMRVSPIGIDNENAKGGYTDENDRIIVSNDKNSQFKGIKIAGKVIPVTKEQEGKKFTIEFDNGLPSPEYSFGSGDPTSPKEFTSNGVRMFIDYQDVENISKYGTDFGLMEWDLKAKNIPISINHDGFFNSYLIKIPEFDGKVYYDETLSSLVNISREELKEEKCEILMENKEIVLTEINIGTKDYDLRILGMKDSSSANLRLVIPKIITANIVQDGQILGKIELKTVVTEITGKTTDDSENWYLYPTNDGYKNNSSTLAKLKISGNLGKVSLLKNLNSIGTTTFEVQALNSNLIMIEVYGKGKENIIVKDYYCKITNLNFDEVFDMSREGIGKVKEGVTTFELPDNNNIEIYQSESQLASIKGSDFKNSGYEIPNSGLKLRYSTSSQKLSIEKLAYKELNESYKLQLKSAGVVVKEIIIELKNKKGFEIIDGYGKLDFGDFFPGDIKQARDTIKFKNPENANIKMELKEKAIEMNKLGVTIPTENQKIQVRKLEVYDLNTKNPDENHFQIKGEAVTTPATEVGKYKGVAEVIITIIP